MLVKIYPAEGFGAHIRSVTELATEVSAVRNIAETAAGGGVPEAPVDSNVYVRSGAGWVIPIDKGYDNIGSFVSLDTQVGISDVPKTVTFGVGGSAGGHITIDAGGVITVVTSGYYSIKQRFRAGREGASGTSDIHFWAELSTDGGSSWSVLGNSVDLSLESSKEITVFFDIASIYLTTGLKLRNRFARNGDGDDSGDLIVGNPSAALVTYGVLPAPSAQITVYKI